MSLRVRLVASLGVVLAVALVAAGALLTGLVRIGLVERVDRELTSISTAALPLQRLMTTQAEDSSGGRSIAVVRLSRQGAVTLTLPSGFAVIATACCRTAMGCASRDG